MSTGLLIRSVTPFTAEAEFPLGHTFTLALRPTKLSMHRHSTDFRRSYGPERPAHIEFCSSRKGGYIWPTVV
jgi:hypothetical protein